MMGLGTSYLPSQVLSSSSTRRLGHAILVTKNIKSNSGSVENTMLRLSTYISRLV